MIARIAPMWMELRQAQARVVSSGMTFFREC
jgi:hypothetical protein